MARQAIRRSPATHGSIRYTTMQGALPSSSSLTEFSLIHDPTGVLALEFELLFSASNINK